LLIILIGSALGGGLRTILISIVIVFWASYARVIRGEALVLRNRPFVALARVANSAPLPDFVPERLGIVDAPAVEVLEVVVLEMALAHDLARELRELRLLDRFLARCP
jgi:peptide/nickel transport system permease protein